MQPPTWLPAFSNGVQVPLPTPVHSVLLVHIWKPAVHDVAQTVPPISMKVAAAWDPER